MDINHPHHLSHVRAAILAVAVVLTIALHYLVIGRFYGLGVAIFAILLVIGVHVIDVLAAKPNNTWAYLFLIPLIVSAAAECIYSSEVVRVLALPIMVISSALFVYWFTAPRAGFWETPSLWPRQAIKETVWPFPGVGRLTAGIGRADHYRKVFLGLVIAAPVAIIVIMLFSEADAVFAKFLSSLVNFPIMADYLSKLLRDLFIAFFLIAAGWTFYTRASESRRAKEGAPLRAGDPMVIATFLAVMNVLFVIFIVFQLVAIVGGEKFIAAQGFSYANYAREGFFQLLAVSGIVFVVMAAVYRFTHLRQLGTRVLGIALILETGVVIASAIRRLMLYIDAYGLTLARYWAMAVIIIIAVVLAAMAVGAFARFDYSKLAKAVGVGLLVVFPFLLLLNTEGMIVRFNADRFLSGKTDQLDLLYFKDHLSSDALPAMSSLYSAKWPREPEMRFSLYPNGLPFGDANTREGLREYLASRHEALGKKIKGDWRNAVIMDYYAFAATAEF